MNIRLSIIRSLEFFFAVICIASAKFVYVLLFIGVPGTSIGSLSNGCLLNHSPRLAFVFVVGSAMQSTQAFLNELGQCIKLALVSIIYS